MILSVILMAYGSSKKDKKDLKSNEVKSQPAGTVERPTQDQAFEGMSFQVWPMRDYSYLAKKIA